ncbi:MAG: thioredoxin-like domain-containing protein, partial [Anaerolineales bacterium]
MTQLIKTKPAGRKLFALSILMTVLLISVACSSTGPDDEGLIPPPEEPTTSTSDSGAAEPASQSFAGTVAAPEFPEGLDWLNTEQPLTLEGLKGKIVLLDFWTYGCINCMHVIPDLKQLEAEYPDELVVIGVHSAKFENEADTENIRNIILRYNREHPVVNDKDFIVWRTWGANAWPTLALVDPAGNVVGGHSGEGVYEIFEPVIAALVEEFDDEIDRTPLTLKLEKEGLPSRVLSYPGKVLADPDGERLFIADTNHNRILIADTESGEILDVIGRGEAGLVDGGFSEAQLNQPQGMALSQDGA